MGIYYENSTLSTITELDRPTPVLVFDTDDRFSIALSEIVKPYGFSVNSVHDKASVLRACKKGDYKVILFDLKTAGTRNLDLLKRIKRMLPFIQPVVVFGWGNEIGFDFAINNDIFDFIRKPIDPEQVIFTIKNAAILSDLKRERKFLLDDIKKQFDIIGNSEAISNVRYLIEKTGHSCINILIVGESGTGKELIARAIHMNSARAAKPFIRIDAKDGNTKNLEEMLFGSIDGFKGLDQGAFSRVEQGTIYLNNINRVDLKTQAKILSALEHGIVEVEGGTISLDRDVRVIASSEIDLEEFVIKGKFRKELYYRLNVIAIKVPPLRKRKEDIPALFDYFLKKFSAMYDCSVKKLTPDVIKILQDYNWPGNVRELRNFAAKLMLYAEDEITPENVDLMLKKQRLL